MFSLPGLLSQPLNRGFLFPVASPYPTYLHLFTFTPSLIRNLRFFNLLTFINTKWRRNWGRVDLDCICFSKFNNNGPKGTGAWHWIPESASFKPENKRFLPAFITFKSANTSRLSVAIYFWRLSHTIFLNCFNWLKLRENPNKHTNLFLAIKSTTFWFQQFTNEMNLKYEDQVTVGKAFGKNWYVFKVQALLEFIPVTFWLLGLKYKKATKN